MKHLIIIGVGGFAREVYWHAQDSRGYGTEWDLKGFLDGDVRLNDSEYKKLEKPVLGDVFSYKIGDSDVFTCAIADSIVRKRFTGKIMENGGEFINIISNLADIHGNANFGKGVIVCPFVSIHDHCRVGDFVILNGKAGLGHDSEIGEYSSMMGGATLCGYAKVGKMCYLGTNAVALPHSKLEDNCYVGVGSTVFKHVKKGVKVFGNPAFPI